MLGGTDNHVQANGVARQLQTISKVDLMLIGSGVSLVCAARIEIPSMKIVRIDNIGRAPLTLSLMHIMNLADERSALPTHQKHVP